MMIVRALKLLVPAAIAAAIMMGVNGCDPCPSCSHRGGGGGPTGTPTPSQASGSGLFAVDCTRQRAYVPLLNSPDPNTCNGRVSVLDLSADPNTTDPRLITVVLSHPDTPTGTAIDTIHNLVLVVSGESGKGFVDIIDQTNNTLVAGSPFMMPDGVQPGFTGQVLFDAVSQLAIISVIETSGCAQPNGCTGFIAFDPIMHNFGTVVAANYAETFAFNSTTGQILDGSDSDSGGTIGVIDFPGARACVLTDSNIGDDNDGASFDTTTNIAVVSNEDGTATVINLNGSSIVTNPSPPPACTIQEGGTPPNSVLLTSLPDSTAGSAVNSVTHQAFLIEDGGPGVTLAQLPPAPVTQLTSIPTPSIGSIPNDPNGSGWDTQGDPYAVAMDQCHNKGLAVNSYFSGTFGATFLVEVDLATLLNNPGAIMTALPAGNCAGTATTFGCNNNSGVLFFPLPPESETSGCAG